MTVAVVREESNGHLVIRASGVDVHLTSSLDSVGEIWMIIEPDEVGWEILAQSNGDDPRGLKLILRRI